MLAVRAVFLVAFLAIAIFTMLAPRAFAQLGFPGLETSVIINANPVRPGPGERVRLTTQSVLLDLSNMKVTWKVNGVIIAEGIGLGEAEFTTGALGSVHEIVMSAYSNTNTAYSTIVLIPTELDLLFEAATFVPPFFGGRTLPIERSKVRAEAIPRFKRPNGSFISNDQITYTWWQNGAIVQEASGRGKSTALLPAPALFGSDTLSVTASAENGQYFASAEAIVPSSNPIVLLYQDHPLFGTLYHKALGSETFIREREMTFVAKPFYANAENADDRTFTYGWRVNGKNIAQDDLKRSALTISAGDGGAQTLVEVTLTQSTDSFFSSIGKWLITFSQSGQRSDPGNNPFTNQPTP